MDFQVFSPVYTVFSRRDLLTSSQPVDLANQMIDGRTIHFHFQYIFPELDKPVSSGLLDFDATPCYPLAMARRALATRDSPSSIVSEVEMFNFDFPLPLLLIADSKEAMKNLRTKLAEALEIIDSVHMLWLVSLAMGAVTSQPLDIAHSYSASATSDVHELAQNIVMASAAELRVLWMSAESAAQGKSTEVWHSSDFSELMLKVFDARLEEDFNSINRWSAEEFDQYVHNLDMLYKDFPLTKHLICIWTLGWQRSVFLEGSPFDFAATLEELYAFDGARAKGWVG
jgi:hypothetical protein